jgi:hypothetical protein
MSFADQAPQSEGKKQTAQEFLDQKLGEGKASGFDQILAEVFINPTPEGLMDILQKQPNALKSIDKLGIKEEFGKLFEGLDFSGCDFTGNGGGGEFKRGSFGEGNYILEYISSFKNCDLTNADLSDVKICIGDYSGIDFTGAKLDGLKLHSVVENPSSNHNSRRRMSGDWLKKFGWSFTRSRLPHTGAPEKKELTPSTIPQIERISIIPSKDVKSWREKALGILNKKIF